LINPSDAEKAWDAWNKAGLTAMCQSNKIQLFVTSKVSIIKALVDAHIKPSAPPPEYRAQTAPPTSLSPPLAQKQKRTLHGSR